MIPSICGVIYSGITGVCLYTCENVEQLWMAPKEMVDKGTVDNEIVDACLGDSIFVFVWCNDTKSLTQITTDGSNKY